METKEIWGKEKIEKAIGIVKEIADFLKTFDRAIVYEHEGIEDNDLIVNFYIFGFDWTMLSGIQSIASKNNMKVSFNVEPHSGKTLKLTLVLSEVSVE
jgi:hypothetical protein